MSENSNLKIIIISLMGLLGLAFFGIYDKYNLFRWVVFVVTIILAVISFDSRRNYWGIGFIVFGLLFNPIAPFSLSRNEWMIADVLLISLLTIWYLDFFNDYRKGILFERYVQAKFPDSEWIMVNATKDLHKKLKRFVESDMNPDFEFRKRLTGKTIAIECKYRSKFWEHKTWGEGVSWDKKQGDRYLRYGRENNIPVYIAIGVGGNPKSPKIVSYTPIEIIQKQYFRFIPKDVIERYTSMPLK